MSRIQFGTLSRPRLSHQKTGSPGLEQARNFASMLIEVDPRETHLLADTARQVLSSILPGEKR